MTISPACPVPATCLNNLTCTFLDDDVPALLPLLAAFLRAESARLDSLVFLFSWSEFEPDWVETVLGGGMKIKGPLLVDVGAAGGTKQACEKVRVAITPTSLEKKPSTHNSNSVGFTAS
ncbi:hypothetical protein ACA910_000490 [Epithemia clementina (nom. ined.)]